jgi:hypothetical protein|uniref:Uncharacterized protein n=1 Tax=Siphoviridae sp. ctB3v5 TaxID=2826186 RepID=A0A8S5M8Q9_9CAUD|nr:MAG TPA: hypothetical protein [Siphoviridae sp. ctB3v5]
MEVLIYKAPIPSMKEFQHFAIFHPMLQKDALQDIKYILVLNLKPLKMILNTHEEKLHIHTNNALLHVKIPSNNSKNETYLHFLSILLV